HGHAIECRLYAEDTAKGFIPDAGYLEHLKFPLTSNEEPDLRVDTGVQQGDEISVYYDPMLAKLICRGANRNQAITRMGKMIHGTQVSGLETNLSFLGNILKSGDFNQAKLSTHFINDNLDALISPSTVSRDILLQAAIALINHTMEQQTAPPVSSSDCYSPWQLNDAWTATNGHQQQLKLYYGNSPLHFQCIFQATSDEFNTEYAQSKRNEGRSYTFSLLPAPDSDLGDLSLEIESKIDIRTRHHNDTLVAQLPNRTIKINSIINEGHLKIFHEGECWTFERSQTHALHEDQQNQNNLVAPMHGKISMVLAQQGLAVKKGTPLVIMEAMKMEHTMTAPFDGHVVQVCCHPNDLVEEGQELIELQPAEAPISDSGED
ncbi:MAG: hypothetical protein MI864_26445, partial [Pseudomonadales bacterium]|nr:hypothetical protein [Pseudomonadales bacterium]